MFPVVLLKIIWFATNFIELGPFATSWLSKAIPSQNDLGEDLQDDQVEPLLITTLSTRPDH